MPKYHWNGFSPGEWFFAKVVYAKSRDEKSSYERELRDIRKIKPTEYVKYRIPKTTFEHGYVRVECLFILCPDFIRNRHTNNSYGSYKKLILMNMGQGFVSFQPSILLLSIAYFRSTITVGIRNCLLVSIRKENIGEFSSFAQRKMVRAISDIDPSCAIKLITY